MLSRKTPTATHATSSKKKMPIPSKSRCYAQRIKEKQQLQRQLLMTPQPQSVIVNLTQNTTPQYKTPVPHSQTEYPSSSPLIQSETITTRNSPNLRKKSPGKPPQFLPQKMGDLEAKLSHQREKYRNLDQKYKALLNHHRQSSHGILSQNQNNNQPKQRRPYQLIRKKRNDPMFQSLDGRQTPEPYQWERNLLNPEYNEMRSIQEAIQKSMEIDKRGLQVTQQSPKKEMIEQSAYLEILEDLRDIKARLVIVENLAFSFNVSK